MPTPFLRLGGPTQTCIPVMFPAHAAGPELGQTQFPDSQIHVLALGCSGPLLSEMPAAEVGDLFSLKLKLFQLRKMDKNSHSKILGGTRHQILPLMDSFISFPRFIHSPIYLSRKQLPSAFCGKRGVPVPRPPRQTGSALSSVAPVHAFSV